MKTLCATWLGEQIESTLKKLNLVFLKEGYTYSRGGDQTTVSFTSVSDTVYLLLLEITISLSFWLHLLSYWYVLLSSPPSFWSQFPSLELLWCWHCGPCLVKTAIEEILGHLYDAWLSFYWKIPPQIHYIISYSLRLKKMTLFPLLSV